MARQNGEGKTSIWKRILSVLGAIILFYGVFQIGRFWAEEFDIKGMRKEIDTLKTAKEDNEREIKKREDKVKTLEEELSLERERKVSTRSFEKEFEALNQKVVRMAEEKNQLEQENKKLLAKISKSDTSQAEKEQWKQKAMNSESKFIQCQNEKEALQRELQSPKTKEARIPDGGAEDVFPGELAVSAYINKFEDCPIQCRGSHYFKLIFHETEQSRFLCMVKGETKTIKNNDKTYILVYKNLSDEKIGTWPQSLGNPPSDKIGEVFYLQITKKK